MSLCSRAGERGQTMTEFALVVPVLLLALFGAFEFGVTFFQYQQAAAAANEGARAASVNREESPTTEARSAAKAFSPALNLSDSQIEVTYTSTGSPAGADWSYPGTVRVIVSKPRTITIFGIEAQTMNLSGTATRRVER